MKNMTLKSKDGKEVNISFPDVPIEVAHKLGGEVWFYLTNSLEVNHGRVVGFFLMLESYDGEDIRNYVYQVEYFVELKDKKMEMRLGTISESEMGSKEEEVKKRFEKIREKRIDIAIRQGKVELGGANAEKQTHIEKAKELSDEIKRLEALKR